MKKSFIFVLISFISCKNSIEENCFRNDKENVFQSYVEVKPYSVNQILEEKPEYLKIENLAKFRNFKQDSTESHTFEFDEKKSKQKYEDYQAKYKDFNDKFFEQFVYISRQNSNGVDYALGRNNLGFGY